MKCQARIIKEHKSAKADVQWPESVYGPVALESYDKLPICGGDVLVKLRSVSEPDWGGTYSKLEIEATCNKCKHPWWPRRIAWENEVLDWDGWDVTSLLEGLG